MAWIKYAIWNKIAFNTTNLRQSSKFFFLFLWQQVQEFNTQKKHINHIFLSQTQTSLEKVVHWENIKNTRENFNKKRRLLNLPCLLNTHTYVYRKNRTSTNYKRILWSVNKSKIKRLYEQYNTWYSKPAGEAIHECKKILAKCSVTERITLTAGNLFTKVNYYWETLGRARALLKLTRIAQQLSSS